MPRRVASLSIRLLGPLEVAIDGRPIVVDTRKALAIVALVAADGRPFARDELAAMFWPEADDEAARGALRRTLSSLRTAVGPAGLVIGRSQVALDPAASSVDLIELEALAASTAIRDLESAAGLARGPFMAGFALRDSPAFDDWQAARAARVERTVGAVLQRLADARLAAGDAEGAVEAARRRVELDPLDEAGQRRLIGLLSEAGDRTAAIQQYREVVALFDRELGVAPLRETTELYDSIREGTPAIAGRGAADSSARPESTTAPGAAPTALPLIGRDAVLATIEAAWRGSAVDGRIGLLEGEAGIGKTRIAEAAAGIVEAGGGIVLAARGYPGEAGIAYGPISGLLRDGLSRTGSEPRLARLGSIARREIARLVDLADAVRAPAGDHAGAGDAGARVRLLDAIADALVALAGGPAPGLVWIDDLHLADDSSREAVVYLARRLHHRPILLLVAWRREDLSPDGLRSADELGRLSGATSVVLDRLDRPSIAAIVRAWRPADDALVDAYVDDSEGLPLAVVAALESGELPGGQVPRSIHDLMRERLASVGETAGQVLSAAAVIGRSFDIATVRLASGRSEDETVEAIEELSRRGIVREVPGSSGSSVPYDFVHGRMRDVAYGELSLARRRLLHRRAADALRTLPNASGHDDLARFARIAAHEREAGRPAEAATAFLEAAARAESVFANREAIDALDSALALGTPDPAAVNARVGELRSRLGEYPAAIRAFETAAALADTGDLPAIEISLGRVQRRRGDLEAAVSHLDAALETPGLSDELRTRALAERSVVALRAGDLPTAARIAAEAGAVATRIDDRHLEGLAQRLVGLVALADDDRQLATDALRRAVDLAADDQDPTASIAALTGLALTLASDGLVDEAVATAAEAVESCRRIGDRHLEAAVENHIADLLHEAGRTDESMVHLKRAVGLFADIGEGTSAHEPGIWSLAAW